MDRKVAAGVIGGTVLVALILLVSLVGRDDESLPQESSEPTIEEVIPVEPGEGIAVSLYYPNSSGSLSAEEREVAEWGTPEQGAATLLRALLAGPTTDALVRPLPAEVGIGEIYLTPSGQLYVDLVSTELNRPPLSGSQEELVTVFSLVDTVLLNIPEIEGMIVLWNGRQLLTFAGHVDTSLPLRAERDLIRPLR